MKHASKLIVGLCVTTSTFIVFGSTQYYVQHLRVKDNTPATIFTKEQYSLPSVPELKVITEADKDEEREEVRKNVESFIESLGENGAVEVNYLSPQTTILLSTGILKALLPEQSGQPISERSVRFLSDLFDNKLHRVGTFRTHYSQVSSVYKIFYDEQKQRYSSNSPMTGNGVFEYGGQTHEDFWANYYTKTYPNQTNDITRLSVALSPTTSILFCNNVSMALRQNGKLTCVPLGPQPVTHSVDSYREPGPLPCWTP